MDEKKNESGLLVGRVMEGDIQEDQDIGGWIICHYRIVT
jgi:hypothetical protein